MSMFVAIFSAIKVFTWVGTLYRGSIALKTPLLYFFAFLFLFVFGGMTGVAVATTSLDVHWHDTYFVVAHFHFIMVGGTLTAFLAARPLLVPEDVRPHVSGALGHGRRGRSCSSASSSRSCRSSCSATPACRAATTTYPARFQSLNVLSTAGAYTLGAALLLTLIYLVVVAVPRQARAGEPVGLARLRVAHAVAAARAQLRRAVRSGARPVRVRRARPRRRLP